MECLEQPNKWRMGATTPSLKVPTCVTHPSTRHSNSSLVLSRPPHHAVGAPCGLPPNAQPAMDAPKPDQSEATWQAAVTPLPNAVCPAVPVLSACWTESPGGLQHTAEVDFHQLYGPGTRQPCSGSQQDDSVDGSSGLTPSQAAWPRALAQMVAVSCTAPTPHLQPLLCCDLHIQAAPRYELVWVSPCWAGGAYVQ
jgi:hypothetical protein